MKHCNALYLGMTAALGASCVRSLGLDLQERATLQTKGMNVSLLSNSSATGSVGFNQSASGLGSKFLIDEPNCAPRVLELEEFSCADAMAHIPASIVQLRGSGVPLMVSSCKWTLISQRYANPILLYIHWETC